MKKTKLLLAVLLVHFAVYSHASYEVLSDAVLYAEARNAYDNNEFYSAGLFFYAFLQRDNEVTQVESNRKEIEAVLSFVDSYIDSKINPQPGVQFHIRKPPAPSFRIKTIHCDKPTKPSLIFPINRGSLPNHHYGEGVPWRFQWSRSFCEGGSISYYRLYVKSADHINPAIDKEVAQTKYTGDLSGTISGKNWTWKVQAIDDEGNRSAWSDEWSYTVPPWR